MDMTGEQRIPADRETVWKALNDADILRACIPGCEELIKESDTAMTAVAVIKVGPISARFQGKVTLSDLDPPNGYRISGEGQGGVAGHAKGSAVVRLTEDGSETILFYEVSAQIGGRLAQLGGRMIDATARTMSAAFFKKFAEQILQRQNGNTPEAAPSADVARPSLALPSSATAAMTPSSGPAPAYGPPSRPSLAWLWAICGVLLGVLVSGLFGLPKETGLQGGDGRILWLVAVILALLQGYALGRDVRAGR